MSKEGTVVRWADLPEDHPIPLIHRQIVRGENAMAASITLEKGCVVASHTHESEQISIILSGKGLWGLGTPGSEGYREVVTGAGEVVVLPSGFAHSLVTLEEMTVIDVLSPVGPMGVDSQG